MKGEGVFGNDYDTPDGTGVRDYIHVVDLAIGHDIPYAIKPRRPGDIAACYADSAKAKNELGWTAERGIDEMCVDSWRWQSMNPNRYRK